MHSQFVRRVGLCLAAVAIAVAALAAADILTQLGIPQPAAKEQLMSGLGSGYISYSVAAKAFKSAPPAVRAQLAEGTVAWAKAYMATPDFKTAYATLRENRKPRAPTFKGTPEEELAAELEKQKKDQQKGAEDMKKAMAQMSAEQRAQIEAAMAQAAEIQKQMDTPEMRKMRLDGMRMEREDRTRRYQDDMKKWQDEYPENPNALMAKRLKAFLDMSATVDFQAKTELKNGKQRFVNAEYESKPSEWKVCYRVGPEAVNAARTAAQAWLKELGS